MNKFMHQGFIDHPPCVPLPNRLYPAHTDGHLPAASKEMAKDIALAAYGPIFNDPCFARAHGMDLQFERIENIHITHRQIFSQLR